MKLVTLHPPRVEKNRVTFSWQPNEGFKSSSYWVEYPDLERVEGSPGKLAEALFPVCLGLAATGPVRVTLPVRIEESVLTNWSAAIRLVCEKLYRPGAGIELVNGRAPAEYRAGSLPETALYFGGGTESLLALARLRKQGVSPLLLSLGGSDWSGSDPESNPDKFRMDETVCRDLGLRLIRVRTNFKEAANSPDWAPCLKPGVSMVNASLFLPFFLSFSFPVCEQLGIGRLVNGNEKMNFPDEYFCFSPPMTLRMERLAANVRYESHLNELLKEEVCAELYRRYPEIAKYQYSCWRNVKSRWCCQCESCLEYYMLLKHNGLPVETVGLDENRIQANLDRLVLEVSRSAEGRPGEIWERICRYEDLRRDPATRRTLERIARNAFIYHHFYKRIPDPLRRGLGLHWMAGRLVKKS